MAYFIFGGNGFVGRSRSGDLIKKQNMRNVISKIIDIPEYLFLFLYLGTVLAYTLLLGLQGFDMCDEGWVLTAYQQLFEHPFSAEYQFLYYNGVLFGALWNYMFGHLGIYGFRILTAICNASIALVIYFLLRQNINRWCIFLGIVIVLLNYEFVIVFHHNVLTALLCVISVFLLYKSLSKNRTIYIFAAGIFVGINIFTRLPNVSMLSIVLVLILFYFYNRNIKRCFILLIAALIGLIVGIGMQLMLMDRLGHLHIFIDNILSGISAVQSSDSSHNLLKMCSVYIGNYKSVVKQMCLLLMLPMILYFFQKICRNSSFNKFITVIVLCAYSIVIYKAANGTFMLYAFCYTTFAVCLMLFIRHANLMFLIASAIVVQFFLPLGSDFGIGNMGPNCLWISVPLAIGLIFKIYIKFYNNYFSHTAAIFLIVMCMSFCCKKVYAISLSCYFDGGSRLKKFYKIDTPLATTFTNIDKVKKCNDLLSIINQYVKSGDYLLCYQSVPMVHYLTHTYPYLSNSWPWSYDIGNLKRHFEWAERNVDVLPVILRNKSAIACWQLPNDDWNSLESPDQWNFSSEKIMLIQSFIKKHNYYVAWENELFQILLPPK